MVKIIFFISYAIFISSCLPDIRESAIAYNNRLLGAQGKINYRLENFSSSFMIFDSFETSVYLRDLKYTIDSSITRIESMRGFEGETELKNAVLDQFKFYKKLTLTGFQDAIYTYSLNSSTNNSNTSEQLMTTIYAEGKPLDRALAIAQNNFCKKYNIKIDASQGK